MPLRTLSAPRVVAGLVAAGSIVATAANATLVFDDLYLVEHFQLVLAGEGVLKTLWTFLLTLDLGTQYRLYGVSKIFHFGLWGLFGVHAWTYAGVIGLTQAATGWGIYRLLRRLGTDSWQASALAWVWILSPFSSTSCFHHYSYLILPYQLTVACALVIQKAHDADPRSGWWRHLLAGVLGFMVASTGESHLLASILIFILVALGTPSSRLRWQRWMDVSVPVASIIATLVLHRLARSALLASAPGSPRYVFGLPTLDETYHRTVVYARSLPRGMAVQVSAILEYAGPWALASAAVVAVAGLGLWRWRRDSGDSTRAPRLLPVALLLVGLASVLVVWALSMFSGQVSPVFPRRYGYVPYTVALMLGVALLAAPPIRRRLGVVPALAASVVVAGLWLTLQTACLPVIRAQDQRVWTAIKAAMADKKNPAIVFVNAWNSPDLPSDPRTSHAVGLRGHDFPTIFESPLMAFFWQSQYAMVVLGAHFAADRAVALEGGRVQLAGVGLNRRKTPIVASTDSVVVVVDPEVLPPHLKADLSRVLIFRRWQDFLDADAQFLDGLRLLQGAVGKR